MCGVTTDRKPAWICAPRINCSRRSRSNVPLANQSGVHPYFFQRRQNTWSSLPSSRVVAFLGFFEHGTIFIKLLCFGNVIPQTRVSILFFSHRHASRLRQRWATWRLLVETGMRQMWSATEVNKITLLVERNLAIFQAIDQSKFILIVFLGEVVNCISFTYIPALEAAFFWQALSSWFHFSQNRSPKARSPKSTS